jgi:hypothetical protein
MAKFTALQPRKLGPRTDFPSRDLRQNIFKYGMRVKWEMVTVCPCERKNLDSLSIEFGTREKPIGCPLKDFDSAVCGGNGYIYHSSQEIQAIVHDGSKDPDRWKIWGEHAAGNVSITTLPEHLPSFLDRLTLLDTVMVYRERRERKKDLIESLRYPVVTRSMTLGSDEDPTEPVLSKFGVLYAIKASSDGRIVLDDNKLPLELKNDEDFVVTEDGKIDWTLGMSSGRAPSPGEYYSMQYFIHPVYVVRSMPYQFRDSVHKVKQVNQELVNLPTKVMAWLEFLGSPNG